MFVCICIRGDALALMINTKCSEDRQIVSRLSVDYIFVSNIIFIAYICMYVCVSTSVYIHIIISMRANNSKHMYEQLILAFSSLSNIVVVVCHTYVPMYNTQLIAANTT